MARGTTGRRSNRRGTAAGKSDTDGSVEVPTRDDILAFVAANPDLATKREIARAFSVRGANRVLLKDMLRELADEGQIELRRKRMTRTGSLPPVCVLDVFSRDSDGGLLARPNEWAESNGTEAPLVSIRPSRGAKGRPAGVGDRVLAKVFATDDPEGPAYTARVMKVIDHQKPTVLGVLREIDDGQFRIEPVERRQAELIIEPEHRNDAKAGELVEVEPIKSGRYGLPKGRVASIIGVLGSETAISTIAIHTHEIPHVFPGAIDTELQKLKPVTEANREDWRDIPLITIDPADAKDHDDAVFAEPDTDEKNPGGVVVRVAIADVAAYVSPGSAINSEAVKRGNSVYFPDRVVPMLPERISNDLCSLRELEDRPALAVRMVFDAAGRKLKHSFHRVIMRSAAKLSYQQAQRAIDGQPDDVTDRLLDDVLGPLWQAYDVLRRGRGEREPLELDLPERKILLKPDGTVDRITIPERLDAHRLIEECMIQANVAAAETLEQKKATLIYRVHDEPSLAKQEALRDFLRTLDISLARGTQMKPSQINNILSRVDGTPHQILVNEVVLRSQSQAVYSIDNIGHFGLNLRRYAHFTSPIRRYADLTIHRALIAALGLSNNDMPVEDKSRLEEISAIVSATERRAMAAERETNDRLIAGYLADKVGVTFDGRISGVTKSGLFVALPVYGADGFIPISSLEDDYYHYIEAAHALSGQRSGKGYRLGDSVEVRLLEIAPLAGDMRFEMLSEPGPLPGMTRSFHKSKGRRRGAGKTGRARHTRKRR